MRDTDKLIEDLATNAKPVKPLAPPFLRAARCSPDSSQSWQHSPRSADT